MGFLPKQGGFFGQNVEKTLKPWRCTPFSGKIANWGLTRLTAYGILFSQRRLANSNHDAPKNGASASAPFHSSIPYSLFLGRMQHSGLLCIRCAAHRALVRHCAQMKTKTGHSAWPPECPDFCFYKDFDSDEFLCLDDLFYSSMISTKWTSTQGISSCVLVSARVIWVIPVNSP